MKNAFKANAYRRLSSPFAIFIQLVSYDAPGRLAAHQHVARSAPTR